MQLSIHNWMRAEPVETTIRRIAKLGYHKLEIAGDPKAYDTKEVRKLLKDNGLGCWGSVRCPPDQQNLGAYLQWHARSLCLA